MTELRALQAELFADSERWFPEVHASGDERLVEVFALGLAGETGEAVNLVKKTARGDQLFHYGTADLALELADVAISLMGLATAAGIDLENSIAKKRRILERRWDDDQ